MKIKILTYSILFSLIVFSSDKVQAQDPHFSLWQYAPLYTNPALGSVYDGQFRASVNYRNQWFAFLGNDAFKTVHASFDARLPVFNNDYISLGINVLSDKAGQAQYSQNTGNLTASYMKLLADDYRTGQAHYLVAGGQIGFGQRGINWDNLQFSTQFNGDTFDPDIPNGEVFGENSLTYMDINAGLMWYGVFDDRFSIWAGASGYHLNSPSVHFIDNTSEPLYTKVSFQAGGEIPLGQDLSILPSVLFMTQGPSLEIAIGASLRYAQTRYWDDVALRAGFMQRTVGRYDGSLASDALAVSAGVEYQRLMMMINYDLNSSSLTRATNNRGAFELSLIYTHPSGDRGSKVKCPRF